MLPCFAFLFLSSDLSYFDRSLSYLRCRIVAPVLRSLRFPSSSLIYDLWFTLLQLISLPAHLYAVTASLVSARFSHAWLCPLTQDSSENDALDLFLYASQIEEMALYYISISLRLVSSKRTSFYLPFSLDFPAARWYTNDFYFFFMSWRNKHAIWTTFRTLTTSIIVDTTLPVVFFRNNPRFDFSFSWLACTRAIAKRLLYNRPRPLELIFQCFIARYYVKCRSVGYPRNTSRIYFTFAH